MSHCRVVFFAKLNETVQTAPMRRKENINRGFSGLEKAISLHRGFMGEFLISFIELETQILPHVTESGMRNLANF